MGRTGHTIENPAIGHRIIFLQTAEQTNGELLQIEYVVARQETKPRIPMHVHLVGEERFEVLKGRLGVTISNKRRVLNEREEVLISPGTPHTF